MYSEKEGTTENIKYYRGSSTSELHVRQQGTTLFTFNHYRRFNGDPLYARYEDFALLNKIKR